MQQGLVSGERADGWQAVELMQLMLLPLTAAEVTRALVDGRLRAGDLAGACEVEARCPMTIPLVLFPVSCGFPSPADDYLDRPLDFNELLIANKPATFSVWIQGDSMKDAGIFDGDLAVIDRSLTPWDGCIIVALLDNEFTCKRFRLTAGGVVLHPENRAYRDVHVGEAQQFEVWGVVKNTIRSKF